MKQSIIHIGNYKYLIEQYDSTDIKDYQYLSEFVFIRNFSLMNNIVNDTDIYFIEKQYLNEYIGELKNNEEPIGTKLVFPITDNAVNSYSSSYTKFNSSYSFENNSAIYDDEGYGSGIYEIYEKTNYSLISKKIKCNKIRIYHPVTLKNINAIIDISNYINGIHFHYLCKRITDYTTNSETEIKINNEVYSEFIEVYYPNLDDLFKVNIDGSYNSFYKENLDLVASTKNEQFINSILSSSEDLIEYNEDDYQVVPLNLLIQPYRIVEEYTAENQYNFDDDLSNDEKFYVKLYLKTNVSIDNNFLTFPINITLHPYSDVDEKLKLYLIDDDLPSNTISLIDEVKFSINTRLGFNNGKLSLVSMFKYPNESYFYNKYKDDDTTSPLKESYIYYNGISESNYNLFTNSNLEEQLKSIDSVTSINDSIIKNLSVMTNKDYKSMESALVDWKSVMKETIIKEYEEENGVSSTFLGFKVEISTNMKFTNIIYENMIPINIKDLDDFSFNINGIFQKYSQFPEMLLGRVTFFDKFLGIEIVSNIVSISNNWRKYLINDNNIYRLSNLSDINYKNSHNETMKFVDLNENNINFIKTIKCIVNKKSNESTNVQRNENQQRVILKPIFYKVKDLQNISLKKGLDQKIGINLSEYMTKVETFKLIIENKEYIEIGRNDVYVIFDINTILLNNNEGEYNIINQDNEYLSSGKWSLS